MKKNNLQSIVILTLVGGLLFGAVVAPLASAYLDQGYYYGLRVKNGTNSIKDYWLQKSYEPGHWFEYFIDANILPGHTDERLFYVDSPYEHFQIRIKWQIRIGNSYHFRYSDWQFVGNPGGWKYFTIYPTGGGCFLADTPINMADGSVKNIQNVIVGDEVISFDESTKKLASAKVSEVFHHVGDEMSESYLIINDNIRVTQNHPLYINGKWEQAGNAEIGDNLLGINGLPIAIQSIETVNEKVPTYNLEVDTYHNYFAEGILAHNKPPNFACLFIDEGP